MDMYVVESSNPPLLGIASFESLQLHRIWSTSVVSVIGNVDKYIHKITLQPHAVPVKQKLRRVPLSLRDKVSQELKSLVDSDIIEPIHESDWASNLVVVQKPSGNLRLCVDLRELNKNIVSNMYPLPHIDEVFLKLEDCCVYSTIDLKHAFLQVPLHPDSRSLTAFISHEGLFQFKKNSIRTGQRSLCVSTPHDRDPRGPARHTARSTWTISLSEVVRKPSMMKGWTTSS